jgi:class 3 adenylate cyclase
MVSTGTRAVSARLRGFGLGGLIVALGCAAFAAGLLHSLDHVGLDLHFRHFGRVEADPRLVLIDIDDGALRNEPWPWPRRRFAELVSTLHELGARATALDILFIEPHAPRRAGATLRPGYDIDDGLPILGDPRDDATVLDDDELRGAIAAAGNVYLAMFAPLTPPRDEPQPRRDATRQAVRDAAQGFFGDHPNGSLAEFLGLNLPEPNVHVVSPERSLLVSAYREEAARRAVLRKAAPWDASLTPHLVHAYDESWPLEKFARVAGGVGMVAYERTRAGAVLRSLPMLVEASGQVLPQLGFLVGCDGLGIDWRDTFDDEGDLLVVRDAQELRIPMDRQGLTLINWHVPQDRTRWQDSFVHVPAGRLLEIADNRRAVEENARRLAIRVAELVRLRHEETPGEFVRYAELIGRRRVADAASTEAMGAAIDTIEQDARLWLERVHQLWRDEEPRNEDERKAQDEIDRLHAEMIKGELPAEIARADAALEARIAVLIEDLGPIIAGRICLVGATATGVADLVATPIHSALPGVMVHANVVNMLLQGDVPERAPIGVNLLMVLLGGLGIAGITSIRGPRFSLVALGLIAVTLFAVGAGVFHYRTMHLPALPAMLVMTVAWAGVTVYRQLTEERARRQLQQALARYTSPAVASRIVERIGPDDLGPTMTQATCFFCDLAGFTPLSERLGPQRTREVLNPYLGAVSDLLVAQGAIVNKFMGDGVFAFFNTPIWPCANHAEAGCHSAVDAVSALRALNRELGALDDDRPLTMRVGLATGEVFVGDYGSDAKLDYTCIGDTVNVASRLEQANKALATTILVDERTRRLGGDRFGYRYLGLIEVEGRIVPVATYELVGAAGELDGSARQYMASFARAVAHYQACEWDACEEALYECRGLRPQDRAVDVYARAVSDMRMLPPGDDWNHAVRLVHG